MATRKLVLHFDINQTVVVADKAQLYGPVEALNAFLTTVLWGKQTSCNSGASGCDPFDHTDWEWCSSIPSLDPPHPGAISYYKYMENKFKGNPAIDRSQFKEHLRRFTSTSEGDSFRSHFDELSKSLQWESCKPGVIEHDSWCEDLIVMGTDGMPYHYILPSFIHLLYQLQEKGRDFSVIFRSFGSDGPIVTRCLRNVFEGLHPDFKNRKIQKQICTSQGRVTRLNPISSASPGFQLMLPSQTNEATGDLHDFSTFTTYVNAQDAYNALSNLSGVTSVQDDYLFWRQQGFKSRAAKPFIIDLIDANHHHVFFDDNLRIHAPDNIVDTRVLKENGQIVSLNPSELTHLQDACLVQTNLLESITNMNYFVDKVQRCEDRYNSLILNTL